MPRKAAMRMVNELWAVRLAQHGIQTIELLPGIMLTDMTAGILGKTIPKMPIFFISLPAKMLISYGITIIILPVLIFGIAHIRNAYNRPNRRAVRVGYGLFAAALDDYRVRYIERIVGFFRHAAQGLEERKQILYLLGPVGGGKSSLADALKMIFTGSGECATIDWQFIGLSMPAWVLICVVILGSAGPTPC